MRDKEQRKLKREGNGVKETPEMQPDLASMDDAVSGAMTAREMWKLLAIMTVKESEGDLGILGRGENYAAPLLQWILSRYQLYGNHRRNST